MSLTAMVREVNEDSPHSRDVLPRKEISRIVDNAVRRYRSGDDYSADSLKAIHTAEEVILEVAMVDMKYALQLARLMDNSHPISYSILVPRIYKNGDSFCDLTHPFVHASPRTEVPRASRSYSLR